MQLRLSATNKVSCTICFYCVSIFSEGHKFVIEGEVGNSVVPRQEGKDENLGGYERARKGRTFCEIDTERRWYRADPTRVTYYRAAGTKSNLFCCYFQRTAEPLVREEIWEIELSGSIIGRWGSSGY